jgi:hypothetical protein
MRLNILSASRPYVAPVVAVEGEPDPRYPRNARNQPEFGSVLLTLDHLIGSSQDHNVHFKAVYSTQTPAEALLSLMHDYYPAHGAPGLAIKDMATFEILKQLDDKPESAIALYFVPVVVDRMGGNIVQVVLSMIALQRLIAHPAYGNGSALLGMDALVGAVGSIAKAATEQTGSLPPLLLLELQDRAADREADQRVSA